MRKRVSVIIGAKIPPTGLSTAFHPPGLRKYGKVGSPRDVQRFKSSVVKAVIGMGAKEVRIVEKVHKSEKEPLLGGSVVDSRIWNDKSIFRSPKKRKNGKK